MENSNSLFHHPQTAARVTTASQPFERVKLSSSHLRNAVEYTGDRAHSLLPSALRRIVSAVRPVAVGVPGGRSSELNCLKAWP
ncbi:hypothetical protein D0A34_17885 [Microcoleus vaginatus PCC 9802]|nr:hypothetical protein D0A34_17885 [Microcoleus vaginatus PCC 9802]